MSRYQKSKEEVKQFAIDWQADFSNHNYSYSELEVFKICFPAWGVNMAYCGSFGKTGLFEGVQL